jgi:2-dehydropantoate 2-reductase
LRVHYGALGEEQGLKTIMDRIIDEVFRVGQKRGVRFLWKSADEYRELFYSKLLPATYDHQSSMLQDLERARRTEIDALNGKIWRYGAELGIPTPFNEAVTHLIRGRESYPRPRREG